MKASKGNKVYEIVEQQKKAYQDAGFDILEDDGKIIAYGRGKTVTYEEHVALQTECADLQTECANLQTELEKLNEESKATKVAAEPVPEAKQKSTDKKAGG